MKIYNSSIYDYDEDNLSPYNFRKKYGNEGILQFLYNEYKNLKIMIMIIILKSKLIILIYIIYMFHQ